MLVYKKEILMYVKFETKIIWMNESKHPNDFGRSSQWNREDIQMNFPTPFDCSLSAYDRNN
jgi:hypothetical protein